MNVKQRHQRSPPLFRRGLETVKRIKFRSLRIVIDAELFNEENLIQMFIVSVADLIGGRIMPSLRLFLTQQLQTRIHLALDPK